MDNRATENLGKRALVATLKFAVWFGVLIFLPAGSLHYWQGWTIWAHVCAWSLALTLYFLAYDRALLQRRLNAGPTAEREPTQRRIQLFASVAICALIIVSALDYRFGWSTVPFWAVGAGNALVALGFLSVLAVLRENSFASAIIEVGEGQKVISTGPYALVRHPMYAGALPLFLGIPPALGSWWGLIAVPPVAAVLVARLLDEEKYLIRNLPGYGAYCASVRYRLVPGLW